MPSIDSTARATRDPVASLVALCDRGTLRHDARGAVVVATGRVEGRAVACYASDPAQLAGSFGSVETDALERLLARAERERLPVVGFVASGGARIHDGLVALDGFARIFRRQVAMRGSALQVTVVCGASAGGGCYAPALSDVVVMTAGAAMFLTGPAVVEQALGERVAADALGGPRVHERSGVCDLVAADEAEAAALVRRLLSFVPPVAPAAPVAPEREDPGSVLPVRRRAVYDVRDVMRGVVDGGSLFELAAGSARNVVVALARLAGRPVGVVANQPWRLGGILDCAACAKASRLVSFCDAYALPLVVLVDTPGFMPGTRQEHAGIIRSGAELLRAFGEATVPRVTVVLRRAYGGAYIAMTSRHLGGDVVLAWEGAELGVMGPHAAVRTIHARRLTGLADPAPARERLVAEYARDRLGVDRALAVGSIDAVIAPRETRARVAEALGVPPGLRVSRRSRASAASARS
jgi:acetyl-CoA carboxylase carboxyltransferase component